MVPDSFFFVDFSPPSGRSCFPTFFPTLFLRSFPRKPCFAPPSSGQDFSAPLAFSEVYISILQFSCRVPKENKVLPAFEKERSSPPSISYFPPFISIVRVLPRYLSALFPNVFFFYSTAPPPVPFFFNYCISSCRFEEWICLSEIPSSPWALLEFLSLSLFLFPCT